MKTKILVVGEDGPFKDTFNFVISRDYIAALTDAGLMPMLALDAKSAERYAEVCDGLFLTGGPDIHCWRYGDVYADASHIRPMSRTRDEMDFAACKAFLAAGKPVFGVGRGMQVLNVALGGTLYQDIPSQLKTTLVHSQTEGRFEPSHSVTVVENTPLAAMTGGKTHMVANSFHHQAIKLLGRGLAVMAYADDGVIEAVYLPDKPHFRAYQWHPERLQAIDADNLAIFTEFVKACHHF